MSRRRAAVEHTPGEPGSYQCVRVDENWHATQEQASPPPVHLGGAWTICAVWAPFTRGYERRRPDCSYCLRAVEKDEGVYVEPAPRPAVPAPAKRAAAIQAHAAEAADLDQRLQALVESTRKGRR